MKTFPDLASAQAYTATLPVGTFAVSQNLDGSTQVVEGLSPNANVPQTVSAFQLKEALANAGLYTSFNTFMSTAPLASQIAWSEAMTFSRNDQFLAAAVSALSVTSAQMDAVFVAAAQITS